MSLTQVNKNQKFTRLVVAGLVGTFGFYIAAFIDMEITGVPLDITIVLGQMVAGDHELSQVFGHVFHIANGVGLTLFFGYVFLPISSRIIKGKIWLHGIVFGVIVTVTAVWLGLLPALGAGVAGLNIAYEVPAMTIFRHVIFGAIIGILFKQNMEKRN